MADKTFSVMVNKDGVIDYPSNFITANSVATKTDLTNKQDKLTFVKEDASIGDLYLGDTGNAYITLAQDGGTMEINSTTLIISNTNPININSDGGFVGSAIATSIGTSETSAKLTTEGAIVKALKNVSGGTPDLSEYLKKSGDTTLSLGEFANEESNGRITVNYFDGNGSPISTNITGETISIAYADGPASTLNARLLNLFDGNTEALSIDSYDGFSGKLVDTSIPSSPVAGHIATTSAIKTYVDNKVASGGSAPSNMVTTDTDQTITGEKTFTGSIYIEPTKGGNYCNLSAYDNLDITCDNTVALSPGANIILAANHETGYIRMDSVMNMRVFNTSTKKWTTTYKYAYLAQDENGQVSIAISDTHPSASV